MRRAIVVLALSCFTLRADAQNLLQNSNFTSSLNGWATFPRSYASIVWNSLDSGNGGGSARAATTAGIPSSCPVVLEQAANISPNTSYRINALMSVSSASCTGSCGAYVGVLWTGTGIDFAYTTAQPVSTDGFLSYSKLVTSPRNATQATYIVVVCGQPTLAYYDGLTLTPSGLSPTVVTSFTASPSTVSPGQPVTLAWTTQNATSVRLYSVASNLASSGSRIVNPTATTTYYLGADGPGGETVAALTVNVAAAPACPTMDALSWFIAYDDAARTCSVYNQAACPANSPLSFRATPSGYPFDCAVHSFSWNFGDGSTSTEQNPVHAYAKAGSYPVTLTVRNPSQSLSYSTVVKVQDAAKPPVILSFAASPRSISLGQSSTLSFVTQDATSVVIDGLPAQPLSGSVTVTPSTTTTYTLRAMSGSQTVTATETVTVNVQPAVSVTAFPAALGQPANSGGASTTLSLTNTGGAAANLTILQSGSFFSVSPSTLSLAPGATGVITITGSAQPAGLYDGFVVPSGPGVPASLQIPIRLLSARIPTGTVNARPLDNRVDVFAPADTNPTGTVRFTNSGNDTLTGAVVADVPWLIPQSTVVTIAPGATANVTFTIDRTKRPDGAAPVGSVTGNLSLSYISGTRAGKGATPNQAEPNSIIDVRKASIVHTASPNARFGAPAAVEAEKIAVFLSGVGHVQASVGKFISDISILNPLTNRLPSDLTLFYTPTGATAPEQSKSINVSLVSNSVLSIGDVVTSTFAQETQGTLQLRGSNVQNLTVNATVFNSSNSAGTYGTVIPVIRSDRAAAPGRAIVLTGLRKDATSHTNLYIQETAGAPVSVQTEFLAESGASMGSRTDDLRAFELKQLGQPTLPDGAVSAILTTTSGRFQAFATPVDRVSGDTWAVADWSSIYAYAPSATSIIPVAGVLAGAGNTFFRTDVAIMNRTTGAASGTFRYVNRTGDQVTKTISLGSRQTTVISDVVGSFFGAANGSVGFLSFTPVTGEFAVTSRTYTTVAGQSSTFGTGVPAVPVSAGLKAGGLATIASLKDSAVATVQAARPATFRTNFGLVEVTGRPAKVRVTISFYVSSGPSSNVVNRSRDYDLAANQFMLLNGIVEQILGGRGTYGDLSGIDLTFQVTEGDGAVVPFTSSVDNGTGDTILRLE